MSSSAISAAAMPGRDRADWRASDLEPASQWVYQFDDADRADVLQALRASRVVGTPLLEYRKENFAFGRCLERIRGAMDQAQHGLGIALIKGLPRNGVSPQEFELMTWAMGLHVGVACPQDKLTRYINEVRDVGTDYRSSTGSGYSSKAELDFHVDGADVVLLSCYNQASEGGDSMCSSSTAAWRQLVAERPDLAEVLKQPVSFSRQGEQAEGVAPLMLMPIYGKQSGNVFCMWVRNRVENGEKLPGVPKLSPKQREAMDLLDEIVRRPEFMYSMRLAPGDLQTLSNHTALHSRTEFRDHETPEKRRLLYRLWLSTPDATTLPDAWSAFYGSTESGVVRGGAFGQHYTDDCRRFDAAQSSAMGMRVDLPVTQ